jgi:glycosyl-4,4'-diaponeurosporenoate acyltransferase
MLTVSYLTIRFKKFAFNPHGFYFRRKTWEQEGDLYNTLFNVRKWKKKLPDGAAWFRTGFSKKRFRRKDPEYLQRFISETCRGEIAHWIMLLPSPIFYLWNPLWASIVMTLFGLIVNIPCIIVQRYNRFHLQNLLGGNVKNSMKK